ncbi:MAG: nitroreductase family protein [Streptococcaceae bacterium]|jgi:predicted oxidoreductase (fatty acid repression mutant protein)|nr:nitroreductase family protein [Streptococcaceae bacterium]
MTYFDILKKRHSQYALGKNIDGTKAVDTLKEAVRLSPTAFNAEGGRVLILTGDAHDKLWGEIVPTDLKAEMDRQGVPANVWENTAQKLESFKAAFGTALFYEDQDKVKELQENFALYKDNFPIWSEQGSGIITINAWNALTEIGVGANLQHYNPVIDASVAKAWHVPASWKLRSQLIFGSIETDTGEEKDKIADTVRFIEA